MDSISYNFISENLNYPFNKKKKTEANFAAIKMRLFFLRNSASLRMFSYFI